MTERESRWRWRQIVVGAVVLATSVGFAEIARATQRPEGDAAMSTVLGVSLFAWPMVIVLTTVAAERAAPALSLVCVAGLPWLLGSLAAMWLGDDPGAVRRYVAASTSSAILFTSGGAGLVVAASMRRNSGRQRAHALVAIVPLALGGVALWISWSMPSSYWIQASRFIPVGACVAVALAAALAGRGVGPTVALVGALMFGLGYAAAVVADSAHPFESREIPPGASLDRDVSDTSETAARVYLAIGITASAADVIGAVERARRLGMEPVLCRSRPDALDKPPL